VSENGTKALDYAALKATVAGERLPCMIVDLAALDRNVARIAEIARASNKRLRVASKSVRVPELLKRIMEMGGESFQGLMCYSTAEADFLSELGFDDLLIAYPAMQVADFAVFARLTQAGKKITAMIDSLEHVDTLSRYWKENARGTAPLRICIDVDLSYRPLGFHLGVQRSPIRDLPAFARIVEMVGASPTLKLCGVMGYEAQIAGLPERNPFHRLMNPLKWLIKWLSARDVRVRREEIAKYLAANATKIEFFNGGGTGSLRTTTAEPWITEVTAGSGFLQSHLFDYYGTNVSEPAFCFALPVSRRPERGVVTCQGGGMIASGEIEPEKAPLPYLPPGMKIIDGEGFGEVQTPVVLPQGFGPRLGDPLFFRPAKAGEIAEHFSEYLLVQGGKVVDRAPTYRGLGRRFH